MENSLIEYNLTLPDPNTDYSGQDDDSSVVFSQDEDKKPIIILFGWAGAIDKYLSVYSRIYEAKGLITLRIIISIKNMFLKMDQMPYVGQKLVKLLTDLNFENRPIIIHCFSNGGAFIYQHFSQASKVSAKPLQIRGVIFDSAPSKRRLSTFYHAIRPIVGGNKFINIPVTLLMLMLCILFWIWEFIQIVVFRRDVIQFKVLNNLLNEDKRWPQHFIYSKTDIVVPYEDVEYFADHRKSLGVDVSLHHYENTQHVKHYPFNKLSYTQSVFSFIHKCLDLSMIKPTKMKRATILRQINSLRERS